MSDRRRSTLGLEVTAERSRMVNVTTGVWLIGVRVRFREQGKRRWSNFCIVPDPDQPVELLLEHACDAADLVYSGRVKDANADLFAT